MNPQVAKKQLPPNRTAGKMIGINSLESAYLVEAMSLMIGSDKATNPTITTLSEYRDWDPALRTHLNQRDSPPHKSAQKEQTIKGMF